MEGFYEQLNKSYISSRVDARIKILTLLALNLLVLSCKGFTLPISLFLTCFLIYKRLQIPCRILMIRFIEPVIIVITILFLKLFFSGHGPDFSFKFIGVTISGNWNGLMEGCLISSRILGAASLIVLMGFITSFTDFVATLSWLKVPKQFTEILLFAYRSLFILFEDAVVIYDAQTNRLGYATLKRGLVSFSTLAGLLVLKVFEHNSQLTTALIQRGYDGNMNLGKRLQGWDIKVSEMILSGFIIGLAGLLWRI